LSIRLVSVQSFVLALPLSVTAQQPPPDYGFDFVTIGDAGNDPWMGTDVTGRITDPGAVHYDYRIARFETRTSQFMEFMNTLGQLSPQDAMFQAPRSWGGVGFVNGDGTVRFELSSSPTAADQPVIGISWRLSAIYCNWLHNDKGQTLDDLNFGAYDTSTFGTDPDDPAQPHRPGLAIARCTLLDPLARRVVEGRALRPE
jgi:hypothetical protein